MATCPQGKPNDITETARPAPRGKFIFSKFPLECRLSPSSQARMKIVLALLSALVLLQEPAAKPEPLGSIAGTVFEISSGAPLKNAAVSLPARNGNDPITTVTDNDGKFVLRDVPPGTWSVFARLS